MIDRQALAAARGLMWGTAIAMPLWALMLIAAWWLA